MVSLEGRIPKSAFKVVIGLAFGTAIIGAAIRIAIRLHLLKRLRMDDLLLIFACTCLTAATGLLYYGTDTIYLIEALSLDAISIFQSQGLGFADLDLIVEKVTLFERINWAYLALTWTTIFSVKFGFLSFFSHLVNNLGRIEMYWRVVVCITVVVYMFSICDGIVACPRLGLEALSCSKDFARTLGAIAISLDIVTDLLILFIPVHLLWRVQMKRRQKLGLAAFLCLNVFMIMIAIIRVSGLAYHAAFDEGWVFMWQQIEACVAVFMISLTAFRSMFVANESRQREKREGSPWSASKVFRRYKRRSSHSQELDQLTIPGGTLTGMRTMIRGGHKTLPSVDIRKDGERSGHPVEGDWPVDV